MLCLTFATVPISICSYSKIRFTARHTSHVYARSINARSQDIRALSIDVLDTVRRRAIFLGWHNAQPDVVAYYGQFTIPVG
jgi:hypothetical protein